ncbi:protein root UVB sensitive 2, chloroplastic [Quillaja saponaria]|nr:protein root UVB sensitive 2, chloroplastic [Quillaja saponaria]
MVVGPLLAAAHIYSVTEEMRATPVNTLNPQRTGMIVANFLKTGKASSPADLRPSKLNELKQIFPEEKFLLSHGGKCVDMVLEHDASGEDALRGWLVAAYAAQIQKSSHELSATILQEAYEKMNDVFSIFLGELQSKGWHTDRFLDGTGSRFAW